MKEPAEPTVDLLLSLRALLLASRQPDCVPYAAGEVRKAFLAVLSAKPSRADPSHGLRRWMRRGGASAGGGGTDHGCSMPDLRAHNEWNHVLGRYWAATHSCAARLRGPEEMRVWRPVSTHDTKVLLPTEWAAAACALSASPSFSGRLYTRLMSPETILHVERLTLEAQLRPGAGADVMAMFLNALASEPPSAPIPGSRVGRRLATEQLAESVEFMKIALIYVSGGMPPRAHGGEVTDATSVQNNQGFQPLNGTATGQNDTSTPLVVNLLSTYEKAKNKIDNSLFNTLLPYIPNGVSGFILLTLLRYAGPIVFNWVSALWSNKFPAARSARHAEPAAEPAVEPAVKPAPLYVATRAIASDASDVLRCILQEPLRFRAEDTQSVSRRRRARQG